MTSHRQFYRERLNARQEVATPQGAVTHPCQAGARYRRFAFSMKDTWNKKVEIVSSGTKRIVKVDGFIRTVVDGPVHWDRDMAVTFEDGEYDFVFQAITRLNKIGGLFLFNHPTQNNNMGIAFGGRSGNPPIEFEAGFEPNLLLTIPNDGAMAPDTQYFQDEEELLQEITLTRELSDAQCASFGAPGNPLDPVFALFGGEYWIHDPRFVSKT
jgi:hypothetical protein